MTSRALSAGPAALAVCSTLAATVLALKLWQADLGVPLTYLGDGNFAHMLVKGILDHGWFYENPSLGAPEGQQLHDYPVLHGDTLNAVAIRLIGLVAGSATALNLFYLATYPLAALTAFLVFRRLGVSWPSALVCSVLYALLPYHLMRGADHLLLAAYYSVPVAAYLILAVLADEPLFDRGWRSRTALLALAGCALVATASGSFYYSGFTVVLLAAAVLLNVLLGRGRRQVIAGAVLVGTILAVSLVQLAPALAYRAANGRNEQTFVRPRLGNDVNSLRLAQLVLPVPGHRVDRLARVTLRYEGSSGVPLSEARFAALGIVGSVGFAWLLAVVLVAAAGGGGRVPVLHRRAALATLLAFLVGTMGGLSTLIGAFVPYLRAWNRISVFIAFFALLAVGLLLDVLRRRFPLAGLAVLAAVLALGFLDQTNDGSVPRYDPVRAAWESDEAFVEQLEERLPAGASVFQLPYLAFPEGGWIHQMNDYDHARGYLHSERLRWSYGAVRGRPADRAAQLAATPPTQLVDELRGRGVAGIYVDRFGYQDGGAAVEGELRAALGSEPLVSPDGRLSFFALGP